MQSSLGEKCSAKLNEIKTLRLTVFPTETRRSKMFDYSHSVSFGQKYSKTVYRTLIVILLKNRADVETVSRHLLETNRIPSVLHQGHKSAKEFENSFWEARSEPGWGRVLCATAGAVPDRMPLRWVCKHSTCESPTRGEDPQQKFTVSCLKRLKNLTRFHCETSHPLAVSRVAHATWRQRQRPCGACCFD